MEQTGEIGEKTGEKRINHETSFHSDSSGNIISEIIVKADFDRLSSQKIKVNSQSITVQVSVLIIYQLAK